MPIADLFAQTRPGGTPQRQGHRFEMIPITSGAPGPRGHDVG
jgi:hypothetical protein